MKERTLDKKFKIRKEAMAGLAMIYYKHLSNPNGVPEATKNAVKWIKVAEFLIFWLKIKYKLIHMIVLTYWLVAECFCNVNKIA